MKAALDIGTMRSSNSGSTTRSPHSGTPWRMSMSTRPRAKSHFGITPDAVAAEARRLLAQAAAPGTARGQQAMA
jgi:hypothetical protein